jgi:TPR repeat protein
MKRLMLALAAATTLVASPALAISTLTFLPPDLDYSTTCKITVATPPALDRDWTTWQGEPVSNTPDELFAIASEYLRGSDRVPRSLATGRAILDYLTKSTAFPAARIDRLLGKTLTATPQAPTDVKDGEALLLKAFSEGLTRAAADLAELYSASGPAELRDPAKSRNYYRMASASGDADGQLAFARILAADPNASEADKNLATSNALLSMIQHVALGECRYMGIIAALYIDGELVNANIETGMAWLEQYAETGDPRTAERLGALLSSRFVAKVDTERAMTYYETAALGGRPRAALAVGIAYASGNGRTQDLAAAERFLTLASDASLAEADLWLARLYRGEFGGTPDLAKTKAHFEKALAVDPTAEVKAQFAQFLAETPGAGDASLALGMLRDAAAGGSGQAAVLAAKLAYANAAGDPAKLAEAESYFRLGVERGRPDAALQLGRLALCGGSMPLSLAKAEDWNTRAIYLGSSTALYRHALELIQADATRDDGLRLMKQAVFQSAPAALAWSIAHFESGRENIPADPAYAQKLEAFITDNPDANFRLDAQLELIRARATLATTPEETAAQIAAIDALIAVGNPAASVVKADLLENAGTEDPAQLIPLYEIGANAGDKRAMRELAALLHDDPARAAEAPEWLKKAAALGDLKAKIVLIDTTAPTALADLEAIGKSGLVCTVDERISLARRLADLQQPEAFTAASGWLQTAATIAGNDPDDLFKIGDAYRDGVGGREQIASAEDYFNRAAAAGRTGALREVANGYLEGLWKDSSPEQARVALASLVQSGDPDAGALMVRAIVAGQITAPLDEVERLLATAPAALDGTTFMKLIRLDETGAFGDPHPDKQAQWLQQAADAGNTAAMMRLYRAYASGIGVPISAETATQWLQRAAEGGDTRAANELAAAYDVGFGLAVDPVKAAYWRDRARSAG